MSFLFKDFLNLDDVAEYLNQYGYSYDSEIEEDYYRLKDTVLDLYNEQKLSIVFYYDDFATIRTLQVAENGSTEPIEEFDFYISGYFHAPEATSVLKDGANLRIIQSYYSYYLLHDKDELPIYDNDNKYKNVVGSKFTSIEFGDDIAPSIVEFSDIRFPKADLDKLFNEKNSELESVKDELADVKAQNAKLIADKGENKATGSFFMGTPAVAPVELETNKQLREALTAANNKIIKQAQNISNLNKQLEKQADNPADKHLYDWQAMNQYTYPPELHLAVMIWEKIYILNEIGNQHITDHSQRFNLIARKVGLDKKIHGEALINRLGKITNPQSNKPKNDVKNLKVIKELNIKDLDNSNPQG